MSDRFESREDLYAKVSWEGGVMESVNYGIRHHQLPWDTPREVVEAWERVEDIGDDIDLINYWLGG